VNSSVLLRKPPRIHAMAAREGEEDLSDAVCCRRRRGSSYSHASVLSNTKPGEDVEKREDAAAE